MIASFTKWDNSLSGTLGAGPMGVPLREVLLYLRGEGAGGTNGKEFSNVRKCVICEVLLDLFFT